MAAVSKHGSHSPNDRRLYQGHSGDDPAQRYVASAYACRCAGPRLHATAEDAPTKCPLKSPLVNGQRTLHIIVPSTAPHLCKMSGAPPSATHPSGAPHYSQDSDARQRHTPSGPPPSAQGGCCMTETHWCMAETLL